MRYAPIQIIKNAAENTLVESIVVPLDQVYGYSVQAKYALTANGAFYLQGSNSLILDNEKNIILPGTWTTIPGSYTTVQGTDSLTYNVQYAHYLYVKLVYQRITGAFGTINAWATTKGF